MIENIPQKQMGTYIDFKEKIDTGCPKNGVLTTYYRI
jgi:hypothetical protein